MIPASIVSSFPEPIACVYLPENTYISKRRIRNLCSWVVILRGSRQSPDKVRSVSPALTEAVVRGVRAFEYVIGGFADESYSCLVAAGGETLSQFNALHRRARTAMLASSRREHNFVCRRRKG